MTKRRESENVTSIIQNYVLYQQHIYHIVILFLFFDSFLSI